MSSSFSDEILMAFADGLLDEPLFSRLAEALEHDAELAARLEALVTGAALARQGFAPLLAPVPPALETGVRAAIARVGKPTRGPARWLIWLYPTASVAVAALALAFILPALQPRPAGSPFGDLAGSEVAAALDTLPSGDTLVLASGLAVHPIVTFTDADGHLCREFETAGPASYLAISCRSGDQWAVRLAFAIASEDGSFRPASGTEALDAYLQSIGAGPPLLDQAEAAALAALRP